MKGENFAVCPIWVVLEMAEGSKVRVVRCPKCENLLPELPDYPVYQCGGCGAVLRGNLSFPVLSFSCWACLVGEKSKEKRRNVKSFQQFMGHT